MRNYLRYNFSDFTTTNFRKLMQLAKKENYSFRTFTNFDKRGKFVLWRHDVDFSMHRARKLARIEADENIKATYFLFLHSEFYNLLEKEITDCVVDIIKTGHEIGLHFDVSYYRINDEKSLEKYLLLEKSILEKIFKKEIKVFSFHILNAFTKRCKKQKYAGLINTYADYFRNEVEYCSDSNGYWRFKRLEDVLRNPKINCLQVLTHPSLWQDDVMAPRQRVMRCIKGRAEKTIRWYDRTLLRGKRKNIYR